MLSTRTVVIFSDRSLDVIDLESYIEPESTWQTGFWTQYVTLTKRNFLRQKERYLSKLNFGQTLFSACFAGLVWFRTARTEETAKDRLGNVSAFSAIIIMIISVCIG